MPQNFQEAKIYKITNDHNDDIYVGSTCDSLHKRYSSHKSLSKTKQFPIYKLMNEIGFERFRIELIENYPCDDIYQLRQREGYFIREIGTLNEKVAGREHKEYREGIKGIIKEKNKEYKEKNKEKLSKQKKEKYKENHEQELEKMKKYREENKEVLNAKKREKVYCTACDCWFSKCGQARHNNRLKHIEATKTTNQEDKTI